MTVLGFTFEAPPEWRADPVPDGIRIEVRRDENAVDGLAMLTICADAELDEIAEAFREQPVEASLLRRQVSLVEIGDRLVLNVLDLEHVTEGGDALSQCYLGFVRDREHDVAVRMEARLAGLTSFDDAADAFNQVLASVRVVEE